MVIPVTAVVDDDGLVHIEGDDVSLVRWNHRPALLRDALQRFNGMADWKPRWHLLAVPTEAIVGSARTVFSLAALDERKECYITRTTNPDHLIPSKPSPTNLPPLRIAARYAAGRLRPTMGRGDLREVADSSRGRTEQRAEVNESRNLRPVEPVIPRRYVPVEEWTQRHGDAGHRVDTALQVDR